MANGALAGIRVVDVSRGVAGAWCARLFAGFGANVVSVIPPEGHPLRAAAGDNPQLVALADYVLDARAGWVTAAVPGDTRDAITAADVLVSDYRPSELMAAGLANLDAPRLVSVNVTPFGMTGALADVPGNELTVAALSGWASINGKADREPLKPSGWQSSYCAGVAGYAGGLAALRHRDRTGEGQQVDAAQLDTMIAAFAPALLRAGYHGSPIGRSASTDITTGPVPVADGYFALTISRAHFWRDAMNLLDLPDLAEDPRWETSHYRQAHKHEYTSRVQDQMAKWKKMDLFEELAARRVVAGPVLTMEELTGLTHLKERGFWVERERKSWPGAPFRMSGTPWSAETPDVPATASPAAPNSPGAVAPDGPLSGLRGIVLTQAWAGTFCTELLGLLGADVIQIEVRKRLDSWRGPYEGPIPDALRSVETARHPWNVNPLYNSVNLNKRCITIDLQEQEGLDLFRHLLPYADFVAENFSPRVLGNLGIDYEAMKAIKPDVILCSLSAYGHKGSWTNVPGIGGTIEPSSGMSALLGYEGGYPLNSGQMYPDAVAGLYGASAIITALHHRDRTGEGQEIDLSMQDANLTFIGDAAVEFARTGQQRPRMGNHHPTFAPHGIYPAMGQEQWVALACESDDQWRGLVRVVGLDELNDDRFETIGGRKANEGEINAILLGWLSLQERDETVRQLRAAGVIAAPVLDGADLMHEPNLRARGTIVDVTHPEAGTWPQAGIPIHFSKTPGRVRRPAPRLGEHSAEVLAELLGISRAEYESLVRAGITGSGPPGKEDVV